MDYQTIFYHAKKDLEEKQRLALDHKEKAEALDLEISDLTLLVNTLEQLVERKSAAEKVIAHPR